MQQWAIRSQVLPRYEYNPEMDAVQRLDGSGGQVLDLCFYYSPFSSIACRARTKRNVQIQATVRISSTVADITFVVMPRLTHKV